MSIAEMALGIGAYGGSNHFVAWDVQRKTWFCGCGQDGMDDLAMLAHVGAEREPQLWEGDQA